LRFILLEFQAVKAEQTMWRSDPQVAIFGLGKRADFARRTIIDAPSRVVELHNTSITIECERWSASEHDQQPNPKSQRDLTIRIRRCRLIDSVQYRPLQVLHRHVGLMSF
jgi:hypothetical protein